MERTTVSSSNINSIGYEAETQTLEIEFMRGSVYQYSDVPVEEYEAIMNADSKGKYFNANIKIHYHFYKL
jgi:hypothetical protein